jgi:hypothetical protein
MFGFGKKKKTQQTCLIAIYIFPLFICVVIGFECPANPNAIKLSVKFRL